MDERQAREQICKIGKLLYDKGMIAGLEGNISCRMSVETILITQAGVCKGSLRPEDITVLSQNGGGRGENRPSTEYQLHLAGYRKRSDFKAAVHAHAPHLSAFALRGEPLSGAESIPEFVVIFGLVPVVAFAPPGSRELGENLAEVAADAHTFLLERHGAISFGADLWEAFYRIEMAEQLAKTLILSRGIGTTGAVE
jgi:L-fuculose-phosphate aldolase